MVWTRGNVWFFLTSSLSLPGPFWFIIFYSLLSWLNSKLYLTCYFVFVSPQRSSLPALLLFEPWVPWVYPHILHLLTEPGAGDDDGGAPQPVPGRVWVTVSSRHSSANQSPALWLSTNQRPCQGSPSHPITRHDTWEHKTICHGRQQIWPKFIKVS